MSGGVTLATPHYGAFITACLFAIRKLHRRKRFNVIFNDPAVTPSDEVTVLYPDRRAVFWPIAAGYGRHGDLDKAR